MKIKSVKFFQQGGAMDAPVDDTATEGAPVDEATAPDAGQDPLAQLASMAQQALQAQDPNLAFQVCQALLELIQQAQAPAPQPVFRRGGILKRK